MLRKLLVAGDRDLCERVQLRAFADGYRWASGHTEPMVLGADYLVLDISRKIITYGMGAHNYRSHGASAVDPVSYALGLEEESIEEILAKVGEIQDMILKLKEESLKLMNKVPEHARI